MQLLINSNQLSELKETLKSNIDEVRDASILISKNLDPLFSQGFQLLEEAQADILIDNQIDNLLKLKVDTISMINLLNIISEYIIAKVPVENQTINVKIRDMYDQAQFTISMKNTVFIEKDTNISSEAYQKIIQIINDFHGKIKIKPGIAKLTLNFRLPKNI
jgi:ferredoxin-fold anticodon binding domain-containing protein